MTRMVSGVPLGAVVKGLPDSANVPWLILTASTALESVGVPTTPPVIICEVPRPTFTHPVMMSTSGAVVHAAQVNVRLPVASAVVFV
jgi:hypothetical protein